MYIVYSQTGGFDPILGVYLTSPEPNSTTDVLTTTTLALHFGQRVFRQINFSCFESLWGRLLAVQ
jgi:hypothetical protein